MKAKFMLAGVAAMVMAACEKKEQAPPTYSAADIEKLEEEGRVLEEQSMLRDLDYEAAAYLRAIQRSALYRAMEAGARDSLAAQRTPGGAALKQMEYTDMKSEAAKIQESEAVARKALYATEDKLRKAGYNFEEATYSTAIGNYHLEAEQRYWKHQHARTTEESSRLHQEWLDFLKVTLDQIKSGDY